MQTGNRCTPSLIYILAVAVAGCGTLRIDKGVTVRQDDWVMDGGSAKRANVANHAVQPPLALVWEYDAAAGFGPGSAAVVDNMVFVGNLQGELHAIDVSSGKRIGYISLGSAVKGTPAIVGDIVYVPLTRKQEGIAAYNLQRGGIEWRARIGDVETSPLRVEDRLYVTTVQGKLLCIDRHGGTVLWEFLIPTGDRAKAIRSSPSADERTIYFGADDGRLYAVRMQDGGLLWKFETGSSIVSTPTVGGSVIYFGSTNGSFYAVDAKDGTLIWQRNLGSVIYGSQAVRDNRVFVGAADGSVYSLLTTSGEIDWVFRTKSVVNSAPLVSGDVVYVGSLDRHLYALDAVSGQVLWSYELPGRIRTAPVAWRQYLIVLIDDKTVFLFRSERGEST